MDQANPLQTFRLEAGVAIAAHAGAARVTVDSPALDAVTDLTLVKAVFTPATTSLRQAEAQMIAQGVRMLFVAADMHSLDGLVTSTDLHGDRQVRLVQEHHLRYDDLTVADVMTGLATLDAVDFDSLRTATVGHLIATLRRFGRNHLLAVETPTAEAPSRVRAVISRTQIERQLGAPVDITPIARSFSEIERALV